MTGDTYMLFAERTQLLSLTYRLCQSSPGLDVPIKLIIGNEFGLQRYNLCFVGVRTGTDSWLFMIGNQNFDLFCCRPRPIVIYSTKAMLSVIYVCLHCVNIVTEIPCRFTLSTNNRNFKMRPPHWLNPRGGEIFRTRPDRPWGPHSVVYNGYRIFPRVKRPERGTDHLLHLAPR